MTGDTIQLRDPAAQHAQRFARVSWGAIIVSFSHMAGALALYSGSGAWDKLIAGAMVLIVDLTIWATAGYRLYCRQIGRRPHWIVPAMLGLAVVTSISLNAIAIWSHRPDEIVAPALASALIAVTFSLLISGFIVAASVVEGELARDRQVAHTERAELASLRDEVLELRGDLIVHQQLLQDAEVLEQRLLPAATAAPHLQAELETARARLLELEATQRVEAAHYPRTIAQLEAQLADARATAERERAAAAQQQGQAAQWVRDREQLTAQQRAAEEQHRAAAAQHSAQVRDLEQQLADARATAGLDLPTIARAALGRGVAAREVARVLDKSDSTIRAWKEAA